MCESARVTVFMHQHLLCGNPSALQDTKKFLRDMDAEGSATPSRRRSKHKRSKHNRHRHRHRSKQRHHRRTTPSDTGSAGQPRVVQVETTDVEGQPNGGPSSSVMVHRH